jgi:hypothetical protein
MEIKTNEYVRIPEQGIYIVSHINIDFDDNDYKKVCLCKNSKVAFTSIEAIKKCKHHRNILYILESGDIVEIEYYKRGVTRKFEVVRLESEILFFENLHKEFCYDLKKHKWKEPKSNMKIKRIMTKEEFERKSLNLEE